MSDERSPIRITRAHYTDLVCAAMNDTTGDTRSIRHPNGPSRPGS
jgi:hypothetical protein